MGLGDIIMTLANMLADLPTLTDWQSNDYLYQIAQLQPKGGILHAKEHEFLINDKPITALNHGMITLYDGQFKPCNVALFDLASHSPPFLLHAGMGAYVFGAGEVYIVDNVADVFALQEFGITAQIVTPFDEKHLPLLINQIAKKRHVTVFTTQLLEIDKGDVTIIQLHESLNDIYENVSEISSLDDLLKSPYVEKSQDVELFECWKGGLIESLPYANGRFERYADGLYFVSYTHDNDSLEKDKAIRICDNFEIVAETRDSQSNQWGLVLNWIDRDYKSHEWVLFKSLLQGDSKEYRQQLANGGLNLVNSNQAKHYLTEYLQHYQTPARAKIVNETGWHGDNYVLPNMVIPQNDNEKIILHNDSFANHGYCQRGSLEQWQNAIAKPCENQSRLNFAICCGFAGVLLDILDIDKGFGFHFYGASSIGKSLMLKVSSSIWGNKLINSWRNTDNAMENLAKQYHDNLLCLDELAECEPKAVRNIAYMLANGQGKNRMTKDGKAQNLKEFRNITLSNGEITIQQKIAEIGITQKAGQEIRLTSLMADAGKGLGVFDDVADSKKAVNELENACKQFCGVAGMMWLFNITTNRQQIRQTAKAYQDEFISHYPMIGYQAHRLLKQMAVVACAGELASDITGWERGKAITAVKACFDDWLERNGNHASLETRQIIAQVTHFLQTQETRFADWSYGQDKRHNQAGFYDGEVYRIYTGVFKDEVCKDFDPLQVARVLKDNDLLKCNKNYQLFVKTKDSRKNGYFYAIKADILSFEC